MTADPRDPHAVSEADTDVRVVMPYLAALGLAPEQVRAQRTFTLRLGRQMIVNEGTHRKTVGGRADYVITRLADGRPLFVIELKAPGETLTDADRDQGVSYARLLEQIAPFVVVTNGGESRLYDAITGERLSDAGLSTESAFYRDGFRLATEKDIELRGEALQHFLGYSAENVRRFCAAQRAQRMAGLRGEAGDRDKKYLPTVYVLCPAASSLRGGRCVPEVGERRIRDRWAIRDRQD
jgi:hypothetical protein